MPRNGALRGIVGSTVGQMVGPASVEAADPAGLVDNNIAMLSMDSSGRIRVVLSAAGGVAQPVQTVPFNANSPAGGASRVVAPAGGATVATTPNPAAGTYDVTVSVFYDIGAPVANEINNMQIQRGATIVGTLQVPAALNIFAPAKTYRMILNGGEAPIVSAILAGTAGVGYNAMLTLVRVL